MVYGLLAVSAVVMGRYELQSGRWLAWSVVLSSWLAPTLGAWIAAEALHFISPRRVLDRRLRMPLKRIALGLGAGLLGSVLGVLAMAVADRTVVPDVALMGAASVIATLAVLAPTERARRGVCVFCGYSQAGATPAARGVCTECGADLYRQ
jgi:hypothetical protein